MSTPASRNAVSTDEVSLSHLRSPLDDIHPVIEPAVLLIGSIGEKLQGTAHSVGGLVAGDPAVFGADADCGESKPGGGDTGYVAAGTFSAPAVASLARSRTRPVPRIGLLPKIQESAMFEVFQEGSIIGGVTAVRSTVGSKSGAYKNAAPPARRQRSRESLSLHLHQSQALRRECKR